MGRKNLSVMLLLLSFYLQPLSYASAQDTLSLPLLKIGILSNRSKEQMQEQWQPLADYLHQTLPQYRFEIKPLSYLETDTTISHHKIDFFITNASHYVILKKKFNLPPPLATLAAIEKGVKTTHAGGVIIVRSNDNTINTLEDIKHKSIAITNQSALGGYQTQAYEFFKQGISLDKDSTLLTVGTPYENVTHMVLSHGADVGFLRSGILEKMVQEGKINSNDFKIIKAPNTPSFPVALSTKLYPEWPLVGLSHIDEKILKSISTKVLSIEENSAVANAIGIYGFNIPADYTVVEEMLRNMRFPPFEHTFSFNMQDFWNTYRIAIIAITNFLLLVFTYGLLYLWRKNRQLKERDYLYNKLSDHTKTMHWQVTAEGLYTYVSPNIQTLLGYKPQEVVGKLFFYDLCPQEDRESFIQKVHRKFETKGEYYHHERKILKKNGEIAWIAVYGMPILNANGELKGYRGSNIDITERKFAMDELKENEARFKALYNASLGGIVIHDQGLIIECNPSFARMSGYSIEELINTDILLCIAPKSRFIVLDNMMRKYEKPYEALCLRKDNSTYLARIEAKEILYQGKNVRFVEYRNITEEKKAQEKLQLAAKVFETAREAIMITDDKEVIIDANDAFCLITGYSREEVIGQTPRMLSSGYHTKEFFTSMWDNIIHKGHWYGEIWNKRKNGDIYVELTTITAICDEHNVTQHYISLSSDITSIKKHEHQLEHIAHHDALTNLPNRLLFADRLHQGMLHAKRRDQSLVVAYLDLDGFKTINDTYGHEVGDELLIALATHMKDALREGDTFARMGGDEFVAVLQDISSIEATIPMLKRLLDAASTNVTINSFNLQVSASLGVTFYPQSEDLEADQLLRQADQAMYQAKLAGKNRYHIFDSIQDKNVRDFHENIEHIKKALEAQEFTLYYQPKVNMKTGSLMGVEALIRWNHPERGILPPSAFLPIVENHPLAIDIGNWVINTALYQIKTWQEEGLCIPVSVNVGARQLQEGGFLEALQTALAAYPSVEPSLLSLEILETSALEDLSGISLLIKECLMLGVHFAMDDFGTGYSSLTYLKQLPVNLLKIDQSFIRDMLDNPDDLSILKGILGLAEAFNTQIIAEGVETVEHGEMLLQLGCEFAQGYGIAKPMPAEMISTWLEQWKPYPSWLIMEPLKNEHFPLLLAITKHRAWFNAIKNFILKKISTLRIEDIHNCNLTRWLDSNTFEQYHLKDLETIKLLHVEMHTLADKLYNLQTKGKDEEAQKALEEMQTISTTICQLLQNLPNTTKTKRIKGV